MPCYRREAHTAGGSPQLPSAAEAPNTDYYENVANICSLEGKKRPSRRPQPRTKPHFRNTRCYLGRCAASRLLIVPGVARRLRRGGRHGRDGALVLRNLGLRVPEVEVPRVAVDEPPPRFRERRIRRRVARALGRRRGRRRLHPQPFSCTLPHTQPTHHGSIRSKTTQAGRDAMRARGGSGIESLRGGSGRTLPIGAAECAWRRRRLRPE